MTYEQIVESPQSGLGYATADRLLQAVRLHNPNATRIPVCLESISEYLGIHIRYDSSLEQQGIVGKIEFENRTPVVSINPAQNQYEPRRRFTLAHEIGHYCLHTSITGEGFIDSRQSMSRSATYWDSKEREANQFAAELLMPENDILTIGDIVITNYTRENSTNSMDIRLFTTEMANIFQVSNEAMTYRLEALKVL